MRKLFCYFSSYKRSIALIIVFICIQTLSELYLPTLMSDIIDNGVINQDIPYIWKIGAFMLLVTLFGTIAAVIASYYGAVNGDRRYYYGCFEGCGLILGHHCCRPDFVAGHFSCGAPSNPAISAGASPT